MGEEEESIGGHWRTATQGIPKVAVIRKEEKKKKTKNPKRVD